MSVNGWDKAYMRRKDQSTEFFPRGKIAERSPKEMLPSCSNLVWPIRARVLYGSGQRAHNEPRAYRVASEEACGKEEHPR